VIKGIISHLAADTVGGREELHILGLRVLARARGTQERGISVMQIRCDVPVEGIEFGFCGVILRPLIGCGILKDLIDGLEIQEIDGTSLGDLEIGGHAVRDGHANGVYLEAKVSLAQDSETQG